MSSVFVLVLNLFTCKFKELYTMQLVRSHTFCTLSGNYRITMSRSYTPLLSDYPLITQSMNMFSITSNDVVPHTDIFFCFLFFLCSEKNIYLITNSCRSD